MKTKSALAPQYTWLLDAVLDFGQRRRVLVSFQAVFCEFLSMSELILGIGRIPSSTEGKTVLLCDLEPGKPHAIKMGTLRTLNQEKDKCHTLRASKEVLPPANKGLWPLALYLYALSNSVTSIREDMKQNNLQESGDEKSAMDWTRGGKTPACPLAAALAVLRDKAAAIKHCGSPTTALADAIMLLAAASWSGSDFLTFEEQLTHYLEARDNNLGRALDARKTCVVGRLGVLFGYALSCHQCKQIKEGPIKRLLQSLNDIYEAGKHQTPPAKKKQRR
eukprot:g37846.t1